MLYPLFSSYYILVFHTVLEQVDDANDIMMKIELKYSSQFQHLKPKKKE